MNIDSIAITASIGVATATGKDNSDFNELFLAADKAVYRAKEAGGNRIEVVG